MIDDSLTSEPKKLSALFAKNTIQSRKPEEAAEETSAQRKKSKEAHSGLKKIWEQCKPRKKEEEEEELAPVDEKQDVLDHLKRSYELKAPAPASADAKSVKRPLLPLDNDDVSSSRPSPSPSVKSQLPNPEHDDPGYKDLLYRYKKLQLHYSVSQILLKVGLSLNAQLQEVTSLLSDKFSLWQCHIFLAEDNELSCAASYSRHEMDFLEVSSRLAVPVGKETQLKKAMSSRQDVLSKHKEYQHYSIPITHQKDVQGMIDLYYSPNHTLTVEERLTLRTISAQLSSFLEEYTRYQLTQSQANRDGLTGLYNHRYFQEQTERLLQDAHLNNEWLSVIFFDLDHFKQLNDTHGHLQGDRALKQSAELLQKHLRHGDLAARYGGEEFVVVMPQTSLEQARKVAEDVRKSIAAYPLLLENKATAKLSVSAGVASLRKPGQDQKNHLLSMADQALYQAKEKGRNQVQTYVLKSAPADVTPSPKKHRHWSAMLKDKTPLFLANWEALAKDYGATEATEAVWRLKTMLPELMQFLIAHLDQNHKELLPRFEKINYIPLSLKKDIQTGKSKLSLISVEIALVLLGDAVNEVVEKLPMSEADKKRFGQDFEQMIASLNTQFQHIFAKSRR